MSESIRGRWRVPLVVTALLLLHYAMAVGSKFQQSTTSDELVHLTGGFVFNHFHDYRIHPENGILPQRLAALPATIIGSQFPPLDQPFWRASNSWVIGHQFFYEQPGQDHFPRLMAGRAIIALFSIATGLLVFLWSRRLFGNPGALVSLVFFVFSPEFLAHGALATSDVCMAFCLLASVGAWWQHLHDGRLRWWGLSALTFGLACVAKFSAPILLPLFIAMAIARACRGAPLSLFARSWTTWQGKLGAIALSMVAHGLVAVAVIWLFFGFRYSAFNPLLPPAADFIRPWSWIDENLGWTGQCIRAIGATRLLPEGYLYGLAYVLETAQVRSAFLNGDYSATGWTSFFPWAFVLKTTPALLLGSTLAGTLLLRRAFGPQAAPSAWRDSLYRATPLLVLLIVYWIVSITSHLNIGHRHILPTYPVLFIACGALGRWFFEQRRLCAACVVILLGAHAVESVRVSPHYLAYFNALAGAPEDRHRHLVDSSLDWGQELPGLKTWLDAHTRADDAVYLSYFGTGEPDYYRIRANRLPFVNGFKLPHPPIARLEPGIYCISATMLEHVYSPIRGPWTVALEREFLAARAQEPELIRSSRAVPRDPQREKAVERYDLLRFARLCHYLRVRQPDAHVGSAILIYRISLSELDATVNGSLREWSHTIENTISTTAK